MTELLPFEQPLGAHPTGWGTFTFRAWAPNARQVVLRLGDGDGPERDHPAVDEGLGVWRVEAAAVHGDRYVWVLDGEEWPDPWSRWQPDGIRGRSAVVDPGTFEWQSERPVLDRKDLVISEIHIGTYTPGGTFDDAIAHLQALADLGITAVELLPVNEFPGERGWGYDGTHISAAHHAYGGPDGLQRFVDAAHSVGLGVILDVVYNHVGASGGGNLAAFGPFFTEKYSTFWGSALNYDDSDSGAVREWALQSAVGWIRDFQVDGLRVDALHAVYDGGAKHVLAELTDRVHAERLGSLLIAESGLNDPRTIRPVGQGGWGFDADWADDFHHSLRTLLTGESDGWYADFGSTAQLAKAFDRPYVFDGDWSPYRARRFGAPAVDRPPEQFVVFIQDHDQVGNRALGDRLPAEARPLAAMCVLLSPFTPMLFMGEEWGEPAPFQFFCDHIDPDIAKATRDGRRREFARFAEFSGAEVPDPGDPATFERSKLTHQHDRSLLALHRKLLQVRRTIPAGPVEVEHHEGARWLRVRRGGTELVCSFAATTRAVPCTPGEVLVASHGTTDADVDRAAGTVRLPALAGVLLRTDRALRTPDEST